MGGEKSSACDGCVVGGRASGGHADGGCASGGRASGGVCESASRCDGWVHDVRHMERERNRATLGRFVRSNLRVQVEEVHLTVAEVEEARALRGLLLMVRLESVAVAFLATTVAAIVAVAHAATRVTLSLGASRTDIVAVAAPERAHDAPRQARVTRASRARQSRVPTRRHNVTVAAAAVSHAAGALRTCTFKPYACFLPHQKRPGCSSSWG